MRQKPSVLRGIATGIAAGITATLIMDQFQKFSSAGQQASEKQIQLAHGESSQQIEHEQQAVACTAFGTLLFLAADVVAVPAFKLSPPPSVTSTPDHLQHWAAHVVYEASLEAVRNLLRRLF